MTYTFKPSGCCAKAIKITIDNNLITDVKFSGGCHGNTMGIGRLIQNRDVEEVSKTLRGIICRNGTSCPDQLALALEEIISQQSAA
ncbi:MAG: TIGR03905 family TSCPD domain-containing protein [Desulfuromonas sp.]|nr:TIGR03905 family TSCPD domain-containing protein [Desulfuromonas sp.]